MDFKELVQDYQDPLPDLKTRKQVEEWRENIVFEHLTPWFHHYRAVVSKYIGVSEHETFNHPVARMSYLSIVYKSLANFQSLIPLGLLVVSTADPDPVAVVKTLLAQPPPPAFSKGYY